MKLSVSRIISRQSRRQPGQPKTGTLRHHLPLHECAEEGDQKPPLQLSKAPRRMPTVLNPEEVTSILGNLAAEYWPITALLYG